MASGEDECGPSDSVADGERLTWSLGQLAGHLGLATWQMDVVCDVLSRSSATMRMRLDHLAIPVQREVALRISESETLEAADVRAQ